MSLKQDDDLKSLLGKQVQLDAYGESYKGTLARQSSVVGVGPDGEIVNLWVLQYPVATEIREIHFYPGDEITVSPKL